MVDPNSLVIISARKKLKGYKRTSPWPMVLGSLEMGFGERREYRENVLLLKLQQQLESYFCKCQGNNSLAAVPACSN